MGKVRMGAPEEIVLFLQKIGNINTFIETGTFNGDTSFWASKHFNHVKTIEFEKKIYETTLKRFYYINNVEFLYGDSRKVLREIMEILNETAIFWLDAHWCSFGSYGEKDQCPLISELELITKHKLDHFVLIDDARLFLCPPPLPNSTKYWPSIMEILTHFQLEHYHSIIYEDVIFCIPDKHKVEFISFIQQKNTLDNIKYSKKTNRNERIRSIKRIIKRFINILHFD